ncbi:MAG: hypothetical protein AAF432_07565 [Planctomycetota bacterium]
MNEGKERLRLLMRQKMNSSDDVLTGMVMGDFSRIESGARNLAFLSLQSEWAAVDTPEYMSFSQSFRSTAEEIADHANAKNMMSVEDAYARMTRSCLDCHAYLRQQGLNDLPGATASIDVDRSWRLADATSMWSAQDENGVASP